MRRPGRGARASTREETVNSRDDYMYDGPQTDIPFRWGDGPGRFEVARILLVAIIFWAWIITEIIQNRGKHHSTSSALGDLGLKRGSPGFFHFRVAFPRLVTPALSAEEKGSWIKDLLFVINKKENRKNVTRKGGAPHPAPPPVRVTFLFFLFVKRILDLVLAWKGILEGLRTWY